MNSGSDEFLNGDLFNKHLLNLKNFAAVSANSESRVTKNFSKVYNAQLQRGGNLGASEESARKSIEALQQVVQKMVNERIDTVLKEFIGKYFDQAFVNIEKNIGRQLDQHVMTTIICRRLLEEALAQLYPIPSDLSAMVSTRLCHKIGAVTHRKAELATSSTPQSHTDDSLPTPSCDMNDMSATRKPNVGNKATHSTAPSTANDVEMEDEVHSPPSMAGRLRSTLKSRKRSFSDSEHLSVPPRSVRAAAQRAAANVASSDSHSSIQGEHPLASGKKPRGDVTSGKSPALSSATGGVRNPSQ